ncbi:MAG: HDOD domain-containing protein [Planctomycetota bacterium]
MTDPAATQTTDEVSQVIDKALNLHTLPVVVLEAERLMRDRRTSAQDVAQLIVRDIAIAERVLKLANSAYYGFQKRIGNLTQAVVLLGFQAVRNLLLTVSVIETFRPSSDDDFDYPRFWGHSVATAIVSTGLARKARLPDADEVYVAGLLHDVGKLLVAQHLPALSGRVLELQRRGVPARDAERRILGYDHSDIGYKLSTSWSLPDSIAAAVRDHHCPLTGPGPATAAHAIHVADCIVSAWGMACRANLPLEEICPGASERLGYDATRLAAWLETFERSLFEAADFFEYLGLAGPRPEPTATAASGGRA